MLMSFECCNMKSLLEKVLDRDEPDDTGSDYTNFRPELLVSSGRHRE